MKATLQKIFVITINIGKQTRQFRNKVALIFPTTLNGMLLRANAPSLSLSPPYLYSCKVAPRPPYYITKVTPLLGVKGEYIDSSRSIPVYCNVMLSREL